MLKTLVFEEEFRRIRPRRRLSSSFDLASATPSLDALAQVGWAAAKLAQGEPNAALDLLYRYRSLLERDSAAPALSGLLDLYLAEALSVAGENEPPLETAARRLAFATGLPARTRAIVAPGRDSTVYHLRSQAGPERTLCGRMIERDWLQQAQRGVWQKLKERPGQRSWCLRCERLGGQTPPAREPVLVRTLSRARMARIIVACRQSLIETLRAAEDAPPLQLPVICDQAVLETAHTGLTKLAALRLSRKAPNVLLGEQLSGFRQSIVAAYGAHARRQRLGVEQLERALRALPPLWAFEATFNNSYRALQLAERLEKAAALAIVEVCFPRALDNPHLLNDEQRQLRAKLQARLSRL